MISMSEAIIVALITGILAFAGTAITVYSTNRKTQSDIQTNQAVMSAEINALKAEVEKHNNYAMRMPVVEEQIKVINHRIDDLEKGA